MNNEVRKTKEEGSVYYGVYALEGPRAHFGGWGEKDEDECLPRRVCEQGHRVHC